MKYKKFNSSNRKYKLFISLLVVSLLLGFGLYESYAKFRQERTVDIIGGVVSKSAPVCNYYEGYVWNFDYTGDEQEFTVPCDGTYIIELWGAQGGTANNDYLGGTGGYTKGNLDLTSNNSLYVYVGQTGQSASSTYNGGGTGRNGYSPYFGFGYSGGGATDIRLVNGNWDNFLSLKSRIMVAAGGGAGGMLNTDNSGSGGSGGGLVGYYATKNVANTLYLGRRYSNTGGSQTAGGSISNPDRDGLVSGSFGIGGYWLDGQQYSNNGGNGGGGGYYGGGPAVNSSGASGGSSFISGHVGCDAISELSTSSNIIHTGQPNHYSGYVFSNTVMIDGEGYNWTNAKGSYVGQTQPDGSVTAGHSGNGYARITLVEKFTDWVTAPIIESNKSGWVTGATISINTPGDADRGVKEYEYYISSSNTTPSNDVTPTGTTSGNLIVTADGTNYVFYRTVTNYDLKSEWSNGVKTMIDNHTPTIAFKSGIPSSVTKGDSYTILGSYAKTGSSNVTASCKLENNTVVTNVSTIPTGNHTITCTATNEAGVSKTITKNITITWEAYTIKNLETNPSFESTIYGDDRDWANHSNTLFVSSSYHSNGSKSLGFSLNNQNLFARKLYTTVQIPKNHILYGQVEYYKTNADFRGGIYVGTQISTTYWDTYANNSSFPIGELNQWNKVGVTYTNELYTYPVVMLSQGNAAGGLGNIYFDSLVLVDLTATFGAGNEPTAGWCLNHINYFSGSTIIYK